MICCLIEYNSQVITYYPFFVHCPHPNPNPEEKDNCCLSNGDYSPRLSKAIISTHISQAKLSHNRQSEILSLVMEPERAYKGKMGIAQKNSD